MQSKLLIGILSLLTGALLAFTAGCGEEQPPQPNPATIQSVQRKPIEEKPKLAESFPESAYVEIMANNDYLYDKYGDNPDKVNDELMAICRKFGHDPKNGDDVNYIISDMVKQLDDISTGDRKNGPGYVQSLNSRVQNRVDELKNQDVKKTRPAKKDKEPSEQPE